MKHKIVVTGVDAVEIYCKTCCVTIIQGFYLQEFKWSKLRKAVQHHKKSKKVIGAVKEIGETPEGIFLSGTFTDSKHN